MTIAALILAAGASTRFGSPKQSLRLGSRTMLGVIADTATAADLAPVIVVAPGDVRVPSTVQHVVNDEPSRGMSRSLRLGLDAVPLDAEAAVVLLGDQPTVTVDHIRALDAWRGGTPIVATRSGGVLGPPALVEREAFGMAPTLTGDVGLRALLRANPHLVTPVDQDEIPDVDTPDELERITEACPGCRARFLPQAVDETHEYIGASPACWAAFGEILAREFGDPTYGRVHRHTVDVYAVQHPGSDDRRQRQSVALHLVGICQWVEHDLDTPRLNAVTQTLARTDRDWPWLDPPPAYTTTVVDLFEAADGAAHVRLVRRWAEDTWASWSAHHEIVRAWARDALP